MEQSRSTARANAVNPYHSGMGQPYSTPSETPLEAPMRKYQVMYLDRDGALRETRRLARALPAFEKAFNVLKQGALVTTKQGMMAVEEVVPGDELRLEDGNFETVQWRGSITIQPDADGIRTSQTTLTRLTADALGFNRPSPDLVLGEGARIKHRAAGIRRVSGGDEAFIPATDFIDGNEVLSLQAQGSYSVYQFGFAGQRSLMVNGVPVETLHPGTAFELGLRGASVRAYLGLFPHKRNFEEFGLLATPRLRMRDLELLD
jgi:hypothetical protein